MSKKLTTEEFIEKAQEIHKGKYNYSKVEYVNAREKVCIICPTHGEFWQTPDKHLKGQGCPKCSILEKSKKQTMTFSDFIKRAKKIHHNKYIYEEIEKWIGLKTKIGIICPIHGKFIQKCNKHIIGQGCPECGKEKTKESTKLSFERFKEKALEKHNNKYSYVEKTYVNAMNLVEIICPIHGIFKQEGQSHLQGHGCPKCNQRKLEKDIEKCLIDNGIEYIFQAKKRDFDWLGRQSFDFYLPQYNIAIECQGEQHFKQKFNFQGHISTESEIENIIQRDYHKFILANKKINGIIYYTYKKWFPKEINDDRLTEMYKNIFFETKQLIEEIQKKQTK